MNEKDFVGRIGKGAKGVFEATNRTVAERGCDGGIVMWKMCRLQSNDLAGDE